MNKIEYTLEQLIIKDLREEIKALKRRNLKLALLTCHLLGLQVQVKGRRSGYGKNESNRPDVQRGRRK